MAFYILSDENGDRYGTIENGQGFQDRVKQAIDFYHGGEIEFIDQIDTEKSFSVKVDDIERDFYLEPTCIFKNDSVFNYSLDMVQELDARGFKTDAQSVKKAHLDHENDVIFSDVISNFVEYESEES